MCYYDISVIILSASLVSVCFAISVAIILIAINYICGDEIRNVIKRIDKD